MDFGWPKKGAFLERHHKLTGEEPKESPADTKARIRPTKICSFSRHFEGPTIQAITMIYDFKPQAIVKL